MGWDQFGIGGRDLLAYRILLLISKSQFKSLPQPTLPKPGSL
jgi:hypothetical protein